MKIKYIFSIVAGLMVLVTASCSEKKTTTDTEGTKAKSEETAESKSPEATEAPSESAPAAYYVMFKGDGG